MAILTKSRLAELTENRFGTATFSATLNENIRKSETGSGTKIFLSHSHADADKIEVRRITVMLRKVNANVYIDRNDSGLPPTTGADTALRLKRQIKTSEKFILVATNNAIASKWCNWDLGHGDAYKFPDHIAIIPLAEHDGQWTGQEYLNIYPRIEESDVNPGRYKIVYPDDSIKYLENWL
ncbi:MAG: toll/interleukin-1 receptor domain-containing protein [Bacteroidota bacterium]|nr:toll/interleukin-1 receptor domain-containing protein [Bacteroidota bacterium]